MSTTLQNSIWPNAGGTLGENKTQIPDGVTVKWPEGDALVSNFVYKDGKLVGFVDTKALIANDSKSTTFDYDCVNITLDNIFESDLTVNKGARCKYLTIKWGKSVEGEEIALIRFEDIDEDTTALLRSATKVIDNTLYDENDNVIGTFDTSKLATGNNIIEFGVEDTTDGKDPDGLWLNIDFSASELKGYPLTVFESNLSNLTNGSAMFYACPLTSWDVELPNLIYGEEMFSLCQLLTSWDVELPNLTHGDGMFFLCKLTSWNAELPNLTSGCAMFHYCDKLTSFISDLSSLTNGVDMFNGCILDTESVECIANTINDVNGLENGDDVYDEVYKQINIGIGNSEPNEREIAAFNTIASKGWVVIVNGSEYTPSSPAAITTLDENGEEIVTPIPYYAKPVETFERYADYIGENGKYYNIIGGQFIYGDDLSTYGMFTCEEDAAINMRLTKLENPNKFVSLLK